MHTSFTTFLTLFSTLSKINLIICPTFNLPSANAFSLYNSKIINRRSWLYLDLTPLSQPRSNHGVRDPHVFPGFLTPVLTQLFFPKPQTTFLACFCRGERLKYA